MIPVNFTYDVSGPPCTRSDIEKFASFAHAELPDDYIDFLLDCNGCVPSSNSDTFLSREDLPGGGSITINQFYSLSKGAKPLRCLYTELEADVGFLPMTTIPIAHDSFANVLGLDCESGCMNWTLCEERFKLDYLRNYELGIKFSDFIAALRAGPYHK